MEVSLFLDTNVLIELTFEELAFRAYIEAFKKHLEEFKKEFRIKLVVSDKIIKEYDSVISSCFDRMSKFIRYLRDELRNRNIFEISHHNSYEFYWDVLSIIRKWVEAGKTYERDLGIKTMTMRSFTVIALNPLVKIASKDGRIRLEEYLTELYDYASNFVVRASEKKQRILSEFSIEVYRKIPYESIPRSAVDFFKEYVGNESDAIHLASFAYYQFKEDIWTAFTTFDLHDILLSEKPGAEEKDLRKTYLLYFHPAASIPMFKLMLKSRLGSKWKSPSEWYYEEFERCDRVSEDLARFACVMDQMLGKEIIPRRLYEKYLPTYRKTA